MKPREVNGNRALVTGAGGFIGSHLVRALSGKGCETVCLLLPDEDEKRLIGTDKCIKKDRFDRSTETISDKVCRSVGSNHRSLMGSISGTRSCKSASPSSTKPAPVTIVRGDITDLDSLDSAVQNIDRIYHLAAVLVADEPDLFYRVNVAGTKNLIEACKRRKVALKRFLFVSSISAFGPTGSRSFNENDPSCPVNDYGRSKLEAEILVKSPANPYPWTIIRPVEIYGPGRFDSFYQICRAAKMGVELQLGEGEVTLGYVDDIVSGIIEACENPVTTGKTYLLGEDRIYSLSDVTRTFARAVRRRPLTLKIPYAMLYAAAGVLEGLSKITKTKPPITRWQLESYLNHCTWKFDISRARKDFGFEAKVPLEVGAVRTIEWYRREGYL